MYDRSGQRMIRKFIPLCLLLKLESITWWGVNSFSIQIVMPLSIWIVRQGLAKTCMLGGYSFYRSFLLRLSIRQGYRIR